MFAVFALFASVVFSGTPETLPGTELLTWEGDADDIADKMMDGAHIYIERKIA